MEAYTKKGVNNVSLKSLFAAKDMTQGAPWQRILEFSVPMLLGNIAQQLYMFSVKDNTLTAWGY